MTVAIPALQIFGVIHSAVTWSARREEGGRGLAECRGDGERRGRERRRQRGARWSERL
jgi:hypothetical protein